MARSRCLNLLNRRKIVESLIVQLDDLVGDQSRVLEMKNSQKKRDTNSAGKEETRRISKMRKVSGCLYRVAERWLLSITSFDRRW